MLVFVAVALASYLVGSIPSGYIAGRVAGIDIREVGSGNIGATNVTRQLGKRYGYAVFLADFFKGLASVGLAAVVATEIQPGHVVELLELVGASFCVIGNTFPVWLGFKGGKGVATSAGALFGLTPLAMFVAAVVWVITFRVTRYVSVASISASLALPIVVLVISQANPDRGLLLFYFSLCLAALVVLRHRSNLSRLIHGTEQRFDRGEN